MYQPPAFREDRLDVQQALIRAHPLGTLVTLGSGELTANLIPFLLDESRGELGILQGHLARGNEQWRHFDSAVEALVIFQGAESYITPSWYATKRKTGKVVPTWNYAVVQVFGPLTVIEDRDWLAGQVAALTSRHESARTEPWAISDAPAAFVEAQLKGIVGIEIPITRIEGKWKVSQNRPEDDRQGVAEGLRSSDSDGDREMGELVAECGPPDRGP